jgi:2-dehydropantoate 2-reductase
LFQQAGIQCSVSEDLEQAHWEKLVWNVPFNGLGVAGVAGADALTCGEVPIELPRKTCLATDELLADPRWIALVRGLMMEVIHGARRLGHEISETMADKMIERTRAMGSYRASTLIDFERGDPLELESLFLEPLRQAQRAGADLPLLKNLCAVLTELDRHR